MVAFALNPIRMLGGILTAPLLSLMSLEVLTTAAFGKPPAASVETKLKVPITMTSAPFNTNRYLKVPPNFSISVYARIKKARFMVLD